MPLIDEVEREPLTLAQAARHVPGRKRDPSTLWRWARHGKRVNGKTIFLEVLEVGRDLLTSRDAMRRFFRHCTTARFESPYSTNEFPHKEAEDDLDDMGI